MIGVTICSTNIKNNKPKKAAGSSNITKVLICLFAVLVLVVSVDFGTDFLYRKSSVSAVDNGEVFNNTIETYTDAAAVEYAGEVTSYSTIAQAWNAAINSATTADSRATVKLLQNITASSGSFGVADGYLKVYSDDFITLDLNGFTLSRDVTTAVEEGQVILNNGDLILRDTSAEQTGVLTGGKSTRGAGGIFCINGIFTLEGGAIINNSAGYYGGGIYAQNSTVYIKGGIISGNTAPLEGGGIEVYDGSICIVTGGTIINNSAGKYGGGINLYDTSSSLIIAGGVIQNNNAAQYGGGIGVEPGGNLTICGNAIVTNNVRGGTLNNGIVSGGSSDNIYMGSTLIKVGSIDSEYPNNFTGEAGIYSNKYTRMAVFGALAEGAVISAGKFTNDRDEYLFGEANNLDLQWEYQFAPATIVTKPTATESGLARQTAIGAPSVTRDIPLSALNTADYTVVNDTFEEINPKVVYTLKDNTYGSISIDYNLPAINDLGYQWDIITVPTLLSEGKVSAEHSSYPGLKIEEYALPALNNTDYNISYTPPTLTESGNLLYTYTAIGSETVAFKLVLIDVDSIDEEYYKIGFYGESGFQYALLNSTDSPDSETVWTNGQDAAMSFAADDGTDYKIYVKPVYEGVVSSEYYYAIAVSTPINDNAASVTFNGVTTYFENFADAWNAAKEHSTTSDSTAVVTLYKDITATNGNFGTNGTTYLNVNQGDYITLDLNGHTLDRGLTSAVSDGYVINVEGNLTVQDSSITGGGVITGGYNSGDGGGVYVKSGGKLTLNSGSISNNTSQLDGGGVYIAVAGEFSISGGEVTNNTSGANGGVYVGGTLNVSGSAEIIGNQTNDAKPGNIYLSDKNTVNIADEDFTGTISLSAESQGIVALGWTDSVSGTILSDNDGFMLVKTANTYALFKKLHLIYNVSDNTGGSVPVDNTDYYKGNSVTLSGNTGNLARTGYTFAGWSDGNTTYIEGSSLVFADSDIVLNAFWFIDAPSVSEDLSYSGVYDGAVHNISVSAEHDLSGTYSISYQWYKNSVSEANLIDGAVSDALSIKDVADSATFYCIVSITDGTVSNQTVSEGISVAISPKTVEVNWDSGNGFEWAYTGNAIVPAATVDTGIDGENLSLTILGSGINASEDPYLATASAANNNYILNNTTQQFYITKAEYDITGLSFSDGEYTYNGHEQTININGTLPIGADGVQVSVSYSGGATNVSDGEVTVTANFSTESENYIVPAAMTAKIKILPKAIEVTAQSKTIKQGDSDLALTYIADELYEGDIFTGELTRASGTSSGKYAITQGSLTAGDNYTINFIGAVYTINADSLQTGESNDIKAKIDFSDDSNGINPDAILSVTEISKNNADERLTSPDGSDVLGVYHAEISIGGNTMEIGSAVSFTLNAGSIAEGTKCEIIIIENGSKVIKSVIVEDGKIIFTTSSLGDFLLVTKNAVQLAKEKAKDELTEYVTDPSEAVQAIIDNAVAGINNENYEDLETIIAAAKSQIDLQLAKESTLKALEDYLNDLKDSDNYSDNNKEELDAVFSSGIDAIKRAQTEDEINKALEQTKNQMNNIFAEQKIINLWWIIILLSVIIILEILTILYIKDKKRKEIRTNTFTFLLLYIIIPNHAVLIIILLSITLLALAVYIIYLLTSFKRKVGNTVTLAGNAADVKTIYNYSFTARLHLNDEKTDERYNAIKNHLLSYNGVNNNIGWKQETFTARGKTVAKLRLQGRTLRVYLGLNPKNYLDSKYILEDYSSFASHEATPALQIVKGPRQLEHALELIDVWMKEHEIKRNYEYTAKDFSLNKMTKEQLIQIGLIKIKTDEFTDKNKAK